MNYIVHVGLSDVDLIKITRAVSEALGVSYKEIRGKSRKVPLPESRKWLSYVANKKFNIKHKRISEYLNITEKSSRQMSKDIADTLNLIDKNKQILRNIINVYSNFQVKYSNCTQTPVFQTDSMFKFGYAEKKV